MQTLNSNAKFKIKKLIAVENHLAKGREGLYHCVSAARLEERQILSSGLRAQHGYQQLLHISAAPISGSHPAALPWLNLPLTLFLGVGGFLLRSVKPLGHL